MTSAEKRDRGKKIASPPETPEIAISLARIGWPVFPVSIYEAADGKRSKVPAVKWKDEATTDVATVAKWWAGEHSGRWIGVYAGKAGIVVLDLDPAKPKVDKATGKKLGMTLSGVDSLAQAGLEIPATFDYATQRKGGRHHVFAAPEGIELTIGADIIGPDGTRLEGVDVRSGNGLMVYYGPELTSAPRLSPAPDWLLVQRGAAAENDGIDRAPTADEEALRERLVEGKPTKDVLEALSAVKSKGMTHDDMLEAVTALVGLGVKGHRGVGPALDAARETYAAGWPDAGRHWDNAVAGSVRRLGLPPATLALTKAERKEIKHRNDPEVIEKKRKAKAREYVATMIETREGLADDDLSDDALADRLFEILRDSWANVPGMGLLRYNGVIWERVDEMLLVERARIWLRSIRSEMTAVAIRRGDKALEVEAKRLGQKGAISAISRLTAGILLDNAPTMDADPDLLNAPNGVIDLRTGELRERKPTDYFTKVTAVDYVPEATSIDWENALRAVPEDIRPWLQVRMGQAVTGRISVDKSVPFFLGGGDNGKSVILGGARSAVGTYAVTVPESLLLGADGSHPTELMTLMGARLAVVEELPRGGRLNAQRMKLLAGTNAITARYMAKDFVTFLTTHTLIVATNHLPVISDVDDAIWKRVAPVPFPYKFIDVKQDGKPKPGTNQRAGDPELRDRLAERPQEAVLAWLVAGAVASYNGIPAKPEAVQEALDEWRGEADPVLGFVRDRLVHDERFVIAANDLYAEFGRYLESRGQTRWGDALIAVSFQGHSSIDDVRKRQMYLSEGLTISRPAFSMGVVSNRVIGFEGIRFADDLNAHRPLTEEERDRATLDHFETMFL